MAIRTALITKRTALLFTLSTFAVFGCSSHTATSQAPKVADTSHDTASESQRTRDQDVDRLVITQNNAQFIGELFADADRLFKQNQMHDAAVAFDRVDALDPDGAYAAPALYNAALAHEALGEHQAAAQRFAEIPRRFTQHQLAQQSLVRAIRLEVFLEHWQLAGGYALTLFERYKELNPFDAIVGYGARAFALLEEERLDEASYVIEKGRQLIENGRLDSAGRIPRDLAQLYYALGELRRLRGHKLHLDPTPEHFAQTLEQRCQLLLDAQGAYSDVMRAYDAHWSAMAGFRVGELYQHLHEELMAIPVPKTASDERRRLLFEGAMRLRYSVLLEKGLAMMEHTIAMAERAQHEEQEAGAEGQELSAWVARAREAQSRIKEAIVKERESIDRLPYSRDELQRALDELGNSQSAHRPAP